MILSMTGFGKAETICGNKKVHIEIKSLNSKNIDISTHIAPMFLEKDLEMRTMLTERLKRGKIDFTLWVEETNGAQPSILSKEAIKGYIGQIREICREEDIKEPANWWDVIVHLPNISGQVANEELNDEEWLTIRNAINEAIDKLIEFRHQEGEAVKRKFEEKLNNIASYLDNVKLYEAARIEKIKGQILQQLKELPGIDYDKGRLEQEMIYYIEKLDINEEKQRLSNHLKYFRETMDKNEPQGKKLGFISQEMGREINTLGSKSNQAEMQNLVVKMKDELEQIKEQVLNVL
ncbi:MAG TPA: YicC family protein [Prevotellaceae bacterium]|nr:YicC family protein [Prevotellaceae bacterium]